MSYREMGSANGAADVISVATLQHVRRCHAVTDVPAVERRAMHSLHLVSVGKVVLNCYRVRVGVSSRRCVDVNNPPIGDRIQIRPEVR